MIKKPKIIKKIKHGLKIAVATISLATTVTVSLLGLSSCQRADYPEDIFANSDYATEEQVQRLSEDLNVDYSYMMPTKYRLAHNNGRPIYVTISEEFSQENKEIITESLDYVFDILNEINPLYYYEISDDYDSISQYSNIRYKACVNIDNADGSANLSTNLIKLETDNISQNDFYGNATHELLHILGFKDVYVDGQFKNTDTYYNNTFMQVHNAKDPILGSLITTTSDKMILPNDYACLVSLYLPNANTEKEYQTVLNKAISLISRYEIKYWQQHAEDNKISSNSINDNFEFSFDNFRKTDNNLHIKITYHFQITENTYTLTISDEHKIIESYSGHLTRITKNNKDLIILKNIKIESLSDDYYTFRKHKPSDVITDFILYKSGNMIHVEIINGYELGSGTEIKINEDIVEDDDILSP